MSQSAISETSDLLVICCVAASVRSPRYIPIGRRSFANYRALQQFKVLVSQSFISLSRFGKVIRKRMTCSSLNISCVINHEKNSCHNEDTVKNQLERSARKSWNYKMLIRQLPAHSVTIGNFSQASRRVNKERGRSKDRNSRS